MDPKEKEKITEAMKLCETKIQSFFNYLDDTLEKKESNKFKDFILANTYFAGGVFRSILSSGGPVNDIGIFFKSYDDVIQFKHLVMSQSVKIFKDDTYSYKGTKGPKISFCTKVYGHPENVMQMFDISFDMHYYDMLRMEMKFDRDTFQKQGAINFKGINKPRAIQRCLKYMNQGWKVDQNSITEVLKAFWDKDVPFSLGSSGQASTPSLGLIKKAYTEKDYFGRVAKEEEGKKLFKAKEYTFSSMETTVVVDDLSIGEPEADEEEETQEQILDRIFEEETVGF